MSAHVQTVLILVSTWIIYSVIHSWLASLQVKNLVARSWPRFMPAYRLFFNLVATLLIIPPIWLSFTLPGPWLWRWTGPGWWLANALAVLALLGVAWSLLHYDSGEFLGVRQWRENLMAVEDQEEFHISPLHRFVRHPWYSLSLVLIWTRDMDLAFCVSAVMMTIYFIIGAYLEEQKLMTYHGERYRRYRRLVPALAPLPWRYLSRAQAAELLNQPRRFP